MGESKARTTEKSKSYQARSLTVSGRSASAGISPETWAVGGDDGGSADPDATGLSDSSPAESASEAYCSEGEERWSPVGCSTVWPALSLKYSVSLNAGDLRSPRHLRRIIEPFIVRVDNLVERWWPHGISGGSNDLIVFSSRSLKRMLHSACVYNSNVCHGGLQLRR